MVEGSARGLVAEAPEPGEGARWSSCPGPEAIIPTAAKGRRVAGLLTSYQNHTLPQTIIVRVLFEGAAKFPKTRQRMALSFKSSRHYLNNLSQISFTSLGFDQNWY